jgi:cell wall-associated NlpC family hydrolase
VLLLLSSLSAQAAEPERPIAQTAIAVARGYVGEPWRWGGRDTEALPGVDCLGLLFLAYGKATGTPWREYAVDPSKLVASGKLGKPVDGLAGTLRADVDRTKLRPGDVLYFLLEGYVIQDEPLLVIGDRKFWPWHTGLYVGDGVALNAHPAEGTREMPLDELAWDALFVTRPAP